MNYEMIIAKMRRIRPDLSEGDLYRCTTPTPSLKALDTKLRTCTQEELQNIINSYRPVYEARHEKGVLFTILCCEARVEELKMAQAEVDERARKIGEDMARKATEEALTILTEEALKREYEEMKRLKAEADERIKAVQEETAKQLLGKDKIIETYKRAVEEYKNALYENKMQLT